MMTIKDPPLGSRLFRQMRRIPLLAVMVCLLWLFNCFVLFDRVKDDQARHEQADIARRERYTTICRDAIAQYEASREAH